MIGPTGRSPVHRSGGLSGTLLLEAVIACFLMVFAFAASALLYDASLRWEARSANIQKATLLAERKMEEIRALASLVPAASTFADHIDGIISGVHSPFPESPEFEFTVRELPNIHKRVESSGFVPTDGVHSPCSSFFTQPEDPSSTSRSAPPYPSSDPGGDFQRNSLFETHPYSRALPATYRLVQVTVRLEADTEQEVNLVSLIGDPILPPDSSTPDNLNRTLKVVKVSGPNHLNAPGSAAYYRIDVTTANNSKVEDVSAVWNIHPLSSGTVDIFPLNASGTEVRVSRSSLSSDSTSFRLFPQIRYEGTEARATSDVIDL